MAIRFPMLHSLAGTWRLETMAASQSGWRSPTDNSANYDRESPIASAMKFQPSALSRPGNLGTAYTGVWKGW